MTDPSDSDMPAGNRQLFLWVWRDYIRGHMPLLVLASFMTAIQGGALGALSYMMQPMFDRIFVKGESDEIWVIGGVIVGIFALRAASGMIQQVLLTRVALYVAASLRIDLLQRVMLQDGDFHLRHPPGYLIQRLQADVDAVNDVWRIVITGAGRDLISLVSLLAVVVAIDWRWAVVTFFGVPLLFLPVTAIQHYIRRQARRARDAGAGLSVRLDEIFHGIVPIKLNRLEDFQQRKFRKWQNQFNRAQLRTAAGAATIPAMVDLLAGFGFLAVLLYGAHEIIAGDKTLGQFMSFLTAIGLTLDPLRRLASVTGSWQIAAAALERLKELLDAPLSLTSPAHPVSPPTCLPEIALHNVSLSYGDAPVLRGLTLTAEAGKTTALVGASGAGKSTVFNILTRLVDPQSGIVEVGGIPVQQMHLEDLRGLFSVVTQEALLFDETVQENVTLGQEVGQEDLADVLDAAHVSDFLPKLADGLDTLVGPRGSALSGGQRQRVVIARALLRNAPILLLDEATSALDTKSEKKVQAALDGLAGGRTTLVIAHRLSTIRNADRIIVIDRGQVVDSGTHDELISRGGIYADLYRLQFEGDKEVVDRQGAAALASRARNVHETEPGWLHRLFSWLRN